MHYVINSSNTESSEVAWGMFACQRVISNDYDTKHGGDIAQCQLREFIRKLNEIFTTCSTCWSRSKSC